MHQYFKGSNRPKNYRNEDYFRDKQQLNDKICVF